MRFKILSVAALAAVVLAENQVANSMSGLSQATKAFQDTLSGWKGDVAGVRHIVRGSTDLVNAITAATLAHKSSNTLAVRGVAEEEGFVAARTLVDDVGSAVDTAISMKPKIEALPILGKSVALLIFNNLHSAVTGLGPTYTKTVSESRQKEAEALAKRAEDHILRGRAVFQ